MIPETAPRRAGHGADDDARARELGLELITRFQGLLRAARLYDEANRAFRRQIEEFQALVTAAAEEETVLVGMGDSFYVDGVRLRPTAAQVALFQALQAELSSRGIGALRLRHGLGGTEIAAFLRLFLAAHDVPQGERLPELTAAEGIVHIIPVRASELRSQASEGEDDESSPATDEREQEIYANVGHTYVEFEQQGDFVAIPANGDLVWTMHWYLRDLPGAITASPNQDLLDWVRGELR